MQNNKILLITGTLIGLLFLGNSALRADRLDLEYFGGGGFYEGELEHRIFEKSFMTMAGGALKKEKWRSATENNGARLSYRFQRYQLGSLLAVLEHRNTTPKKTKESLYQANLLSSSFYGAPGTAKFSFSQLNESENPRSEGSLGFEMALFRHYLLITPMFGYHNGHKNYRYTRMYQDSPTNVASVKIFDHHSTSNGGFLKLRLELYLSRNFSLQASGAYYPKMEGNMTNAYTEFGLNQLDNLKNFRANYQEVDSTHEKQMYRYSLGWRYRVTNEVDIGMNLNYVTLQESFTNPMITNYVIQTAALDGETSNSGALPISGSETQTAQSLAGFDIYNREFKSESIHATFSVTYRLRLTGHDNLNGYAEHKQADYSYYKGNFKDSQYDGKGILLGNDGSEYRGRYKKGQRSGYGKYELADGTNYKGRWKSNLKNGKGKMKWSDGSTYDGIFKNGLPHGYGVMKWSDGSSYKGQWSRGRRNGPGKYTGPEGKTIEGIWNNDKIQ